jgi:hypothetical protein
MAETISALGEGIKGYVAHLLPESVILEACRRAGHRWRRRRFDPVCTLWLFVLQVLHRNTAILELRHLTHSAVNAAAYCKARMRLPLAVFQSLLDYSARQAMANGPTTWPGMRVILTDCTSSLCPDTPCIRTLFRQPANVSKGCGYPMSKVLAFFDAASGAILQPLICSLFVHESANVWRLHPLLRPGDLLVGDRAFCSYVHLAMLNLAGIFGLFRVHQKQIVNFRLGRRHGGKGQPTSQWVKRLGPCDQRVRWCKPQQQPKWMKARQFTLLPATLLLREVRYTLAARGQRTREVTIVTGLLDPLLYPREKIAELYGLRWQVETHFGALKTTMGMERLKCRTVQGIQKELLTYFIAFNLLRGVIRRAAARQRVTLSRISFVDALRWLANARVNEERVVLMVIPWRPDRHEPRVKKYLRYRYPSMTEPRHILRQRPELCAGKPR